MVKENKICDWCGESFVVRYGCECKKLAGNHECLDKAGLVKKPALPKNPLDLLSKDELLVVDQMEKSFPCVLYYIYVDEKRHTMDIVVKGHNHNEVFKAVRRYLPSQWVLKTIRDDNIKPHSY